MIAKKAVDYLNGKEGYNCAQSILKAFENHFSATPQKLNEYARYGGGRAPEGFCGALFAALNLAEDDRSTAEVKKQFIAKAGSPYCREIRRAKTLTCQECVALSARLLQEQLEK